MKKADYFMPIVIVTVLAVLIIPIPSFLLDLLLVLSIGMSLLVLVITTQIRSALQLSAFPAILLLLTLFRLSLNVATTRLILTQAFGGHVIQAFGDFVVGGNYVVGTVIFLILTVINFVVITKGSGRIAEVAARFTLDAMPGKQMSIDADLNSGAIDEKEAIRRREELAQEADFYGAMDGASKFVRGDAIAGLIVTGINIIGGFAIGMLQKHMDATESLRVYTILTIGDGLVAQVPALITSTAAGMLVARTATNKSLGAEVGGQLFRYGKPLLITGGILTAISLVPGLPLVPFLVLGGTLVGAGMAVRGKESLTPAEQDGREVEAGLPAETKQGGAKAAAADKGKKKLVPSVSMVDLEIGFGLVPFVDSRHGGKLIERIGIVRTQLAEELGFILPPVNVRDNMKLKNTEYCIRIRGLESARGGVKPGFLLAINPGNLAALEGFGAVREPAFGFAAHWIPEEKKDLAESRGFTVVDCTSVIATHLTEEAKRNAAEMLTRQDVSDLLDHLKTANASVVNDLIPAKISIGGVHRILQKLLQEGVSIRDLNLIMENIGDYVGRTQDPALLAELCRRALGGHICSARLTADGTLPGVGLHPDIEAAIKKNVKRDGNEVGTLTMDPAMSQAIVNAVVSVLDANRKMGVEPVVLCGPTVRAHVRRLMERDHSNVGIISLAEVPDKISVNMLGIVPVPEVIRTAPVMQEV